MSVFISIRVFQPNQNKNYLLHKCLNTETGHLSKTTEFQYFVFIFSVKDKQINLIFIIYM